MPNRELVKKALRAIERPVDFEYFFGELKSPEWLEPLAEERVFDKPYPTVEEKDLLSFPIWPPSRYLARMASQAPDKVAELALRIPETTNVRIHEDLVDAALAMPSEIAQHIIPKAIGWAKSKYQLRLADRLGKLISHLASGGQVEKALDLARALLELHKKQKEPMEGFEGEKYQLPPEPRSVLSDWNYEQILKKNVPDLVQAAGLKALGLLCDLLEEAINLSRRTDDGESEDYSYIWRSAIESHSENEGRDLKGSLVSAVRDASEAITAANAMLVREVVRCLRYKSHNVTPRKWKVFERIVLHIIRERPDTVRDLIREELLKPANFEDTGISHEYRLLLKKMFGTLDLSDQQIILGWIEAGPPDVDGWVQRVTEATGEAPNAEDTEKYKRVWQLKKLAIFSESLSEPWAARYHALVEEFGPPEHPEFSFYSTGVMTGPVSPKGATDLSQMQEDELRQFLTDWKPAEEALGIVPSREGLGREISQMVANDPAKYVQFAPSFQGLDPTYVRSFLQGFRDAIGQKKPLAWAPIIDLSNWVVTQPREIPDRKVDKWGADPDWSWARKTVAGLLSSGFLEGDGSIPWHLRERAWATLLPITNDPHPEPEDEVEREGLSTDPSHLAINSVRGEAIEAVVRYACWVKRSLGKEGKKRLAGQGLRSMLEVRNVLEAHLEPKRDPSLAIRSVYGRWFPTLHWLDAKWAIRNVRKIFPESTGVRKYRDAAWDTYIIFSTPYLNMLDVLRAQYSKAVAELSRPSTIEHGVGDPKERLAEHLMTFYWHGKLPYRGVSGILGRFFSIATDKHRGHALEFLGRNIHSDGKVPPAVIGRLRSLWEGIAEKAKGDPAQNVRTLAAYGWWFASGKFPQKWSMDQLATVLRMAKTIEVDFLVLERLLVVAHSMPLEAIRCVRLLCEGAERQWEISSRLDEIRQILSVAIKAKRDIAKEEAIELAEYLTAKGYRYFDDLLDETPAPPR